MERFSGSAADGRPSRAGGISWSQGPCESTPTGAGDLSSLLKPCAGTGSSVWSCGTRAVSGTGGSRDASAGTLGPLPAVPAAGDSIRGLEGSAMGVACGRPESGGIVSCSGTGSAAVGAAVLGSPRSVVHRDSTGVFSAASFPMSGRRNEPSPSVREKAADRSVIPSPADASKAAFRASPSWRFGGSVAAGGSVSIRSTGIDSI